MDKKEIIKQSIMGTVSVYNGETEYDYMGQVKKKTFTNLVVVDLDKLANFLAKHLDINPENLVD